MASREVFILPNESQIRTVASVKVVQSVLEGEDLIPGGVCAASLETELYGEVPVERGQELLYYHDDRIMGVFRVEEKRRISPNRCRVTGYDRMILFDKDVTEYLDSILPAYADVVLTKLCSHLGAKLGSFTVPREKLPKLTVTATGRQYLRWLGQRWGMWFRFNENGRLMGGWVSNLGYTLGDYRMDSLTVSDYDTAPIERVWVRQTASDVGAVYPDGLEDTANTLIIQGNPMAPEPQTLYEKLTGFSYRPFRCVVLDRPPAIGQILTLPDGTLGPILERTLENSVWTIGATGNPGLQSTAAWNSLSWSDTQGRILTVEKTVEGLRVENSDNAGKLASLEMNVDGITTRVESVESASRTHAEASAVTSLRSQLTQRADSLEFSVTEVRSALGDKADQSQVDQITEHFRFDMEGLTITNSGTGMGIGISEQRIVFTGGENPTTVIYPNAMETTGLTVQNTLTLGTFALIPRTSGNLSLRFVGS